MKAYILTDEFTMRAATAGDPTAVFDTETGEIQLRNRSGLLVLTLYKREARQLAFLLCEAAER